MKPGITLLHIEAFYWVAQLNSFSAAADRLCSTQPGISTRVSALENLLGGRLFERVNRTTVLTSLGRELLPLAENFVQLGNTFTEAARLRESLRGLIRVGAADTVALTWLPALIANLSKEFPLIEVELAVDLSHTLYDRLVAGEIDVAFVAGHASRPGYEAIPIGSIENRWAAAPSLGLGNRQLSAADLAAFPVLTHLRGSYLYHVVTRWFRQQRVRLPRLHSCNSLATLIELTAAGLGVSVLPAAMLGPLIAAQRLVLLDTARELPPTDFSIVFREDQQSSFINVMVRMGAEAAAAHPVFQAPAPAA